MKARRIVASAVTALSLIAFTPAIAAAPSGTNLQGFGTLNVSANVQGQCTVGTTSLAFGTYSPTANSNATGNVNIYCPAGINGGNPVQIGLDNGANANGTQRQLSDGAAGDVLAYNLFSDSAGTVPWDDNGAWVSYTVPADNLPHNIPVYGTIPSGQAAVVGSYTDTVTINVYF